MSWFTDIFRRKPSPVVIAKTARPVFICQFRAVGNSMLPTFSADEMVLLEMCAFEDLQAGQPIIYWHTESQQYVHHRLVERDQTGQWLVRGDNNTGNDRGRVTADEFVGRTRKLATQPNNT